MKKIVVLCLLLFFFYSCISIHSGSISSGNLLSQKDKLVDTVFVETKNIKFLGFGKVSKRNLFINAKNELNRKYKLKEGEYFLNYTYDINKNFIFGFLFIVNKVTLQADVYSTNINAKSLNEQFEISKQNIIKEEIDHNTIKFSGIIIVNDTITINKKCFYFDGSYAKNVYLNKITSDGYVFLETHNSYKSYKLKNADDLFSVNVTVNDYKVGDIVKAKAYAAYEKCEIIAMNSKRLLLKLSNELFVRKFDEVKK